MPNYWQDSVYLLKIALEIGFQKLLIPETNLLNQKLKATRRLEKTKCWPLGMPLEFIYSSRDWDWHTIRTSSHFPKTKESFQMSLFSKRPEPPSFMKLHENKSFNLGHLIQIIIREREYFWYFLVIFLGQSSHSVYIMQYEIETSTCLLQSHFINLLYLASLMKMQMFCLSTKNLINIYVLNICK